MNTETSTFPGVVNSIMLLALVIAIPLSMFIIKRYVKALLRGMSYSSKNVKPIIEESTTRQVSNSLKVNIALFEVSDEKLNKHPVFVKLKEVLGYHWLIYLAMSLAFATVNSFCWLYPDTEMSFWRFIYAVLMFSFPFVPVSYMLLVNGIKQFLILTSLLLFIYLCISYIVYAASVIEDVSYLSIVWPLFFTNLIPLALIGIMRLRIVRPIGLLTYSFFILSASGPFLFFHFLNSNPQALETVGYFFIDFGFNAYTTLLVWFVVPFLLMLVIGWLMFNRLRKWYLKKLINDLQLTADAMLIIFNIFYSVFISLTSVKFAVLALLAFPIYKLTGFVLFKILSQSTGSKDNTRLLLLRVFSLGKDSRNLFERIIKHWRYAGSVQLISGPDIATSTIEPHELLDFVSGQLKNNFCDSEEDIRQKIRTMDLARDADSTFRVNEFFCRDNNWKLVLKQLLLHTDVVMMDLRSFTKQNSGCKHEIEALVNLYPMHKTVFITDSRTEMSYLNSVIEQAFEQTDFNSPNFAMRKVNIYNVNKSFDQQVDKLLNLICSLKKSGEHRKEIAVE